jgi:hypothetical protein
MMKVAYQKDPKLLFFVQADKSNQPTYNDLAEIKSDWTFDELKTAIRNNLNRIKSLVLDNLRL